LLEGKSKLHQHPNAKTIYVAIPATIAHDSQFAFKSGDVVKVIYLPTLKRIEVRLLNG